jgi:hypothetical protein
VHALNGSCSCPPIGRDLGPNPIRYIGPCRPDTKIFRVVPCLDRAFFSCFGPAHQAKPKCTPIPSSLAHISWRHNFLAQTPEPERLRPSLIPSSHLMIHLPPLKKKY